MRLLDEIRTRAVIHPHHLARGCIERVKISAHEWPDARREIHLSIADHRPAACRPGGDEAAVAQSLSRRGCAAERPQQLSIRSTHTIQIPVIAGEVHPALPAHGGQPHRATGKKAPHLRARVQIQRHHLVAVIEADEHLVTENHRLENPVIRHEVMIQRVIPHLLACRIPALPLEMHFFRQHLNR